MAEHGTPSLLQAMGHFSAEQVSGSQPEALPRYGHEWLLEAKGAVLNENKCWKRELNK